MQSTMNYNFANVPAPQIQRSTFDRSHGHKTTFNAGDLIPIFIDEILPGDTLKLTATFMARLSTFIFPIMDNVFIDTFFFYVPNRLLWNNWEKFNGSQDSPGDSTDFLIPVISDSLPDSTFQQHTLFDYFGIPTQQSFNDGDFPNALPFRAYNLIWNDWFRSENLQDSVTVPKSDGPDDYTLYPILRRGKRHDYFTSCLPWPQKGPSVILPIGGLAQVYGDGDAMGLQFGDFDTGYRGVLAVDNIGGTYPDNGSVKAFYDHGGAGNIDVPVGTAIDTDTDVPVTQARFMGLSTRGVHSHVVADLGTAASVTVNTLRQAFAFQKVLERDARGGTRYVEMLKAHFGVTSPDFRLQRPEYLGGSSQRINVNTVQQTSETATTPQAKLAAYSVGHAQCRFNKSFVEHGYVIGLINVRSDLTYQNGLNRLWSRKTRFDFYLPALAHLGEQAVLQKELAYVHTNANDVFGYQERWAEYRYKPSIVTGAFRSNYTMGSLDSWHLALDFGAASPILDAGFIQDNPPLDRVIAVSEADADQIILDSYFDMKHTRPMPVYSVPGQIDRF